MDRKITIERGFEDGKLQLSDKELTNAISGDQITWVIEAGSGVASITQIHEKPDSVDLFIGEPKKQPDGSYMGTLKDVDVVTEEKYFIKWTTSGTGWLGKDGAGQHKIFDPIISVRPKGTK